MRGSFAFLLFLFSLTSLDCLIPSTAKAQVTPDGTTSTTVDRDGNNFTVEQGDRVGDNLFHSFDEFSVPTGGSAGFNNAADIANIFSRVTGGDISNIDGLLSASGTANLFLINPNGIIFGENARLDLGGSFFGSTADSLLFEGDTEFSAINPQAAPLLEVSIPVGLSFRDNPGDIVNRSFAPNESEPSNFARLEVLPGNKITLVGGDIDFESGIAIARGGDIELGGLTQAGIVDLNEDGSLSFPEGIAQANISLSNFADIDVQGTGGGNITINAQNLSLESGELGRSFIRAGISSESNSAEAQAGDITIDVAENIMLDNSSIFNDINAEGIGNSGNITINTDSLEVTNGGLIDAFIFGTGDSGDISVNATESVSVNADSTISNQINAGANGNSGTIDFSTTNITLTGGGRVSNTITGNGNAGDVNINAREVISIDGFGNEGIPSGIFSNIGSENSVGNAGNIQIDTQNLTLTNGGIVNSVTLGQGNSGTVSINATDTISIDGEAEDSSFNSTISSGVAGTGIGNSGGIEIDASNLSLTNGGLINGRTGGDGNGGNINLSTGFLSLENESRIDASTFKNGDAGKITINATDNISLDTSSGIGSEIVENAIGNSGGIEITTTDLNLAGGSLISANTLGEGNSGRIIISATGNTSIDAASSINSLVENGAIGNSDGIEIITNNLSLTEGSLIDTSTSSTGKGGEISFEISDSVIVSDESAIIADSSGAAGLFTERLQSGDAGNIKIKSRSLSLENGARISSGNRSLSFANSGNISIDVTESISLSGESQNGSESFISSNTNGTGAGGSINIQAQSLFLGNGAQITSSSSFTNTGNGGSIAIDVDDSIILNGRSQKGTVSRISTNANGEKVDGGDINIQAQSLFLENGAELNSIVDSTFVGSANGTGGNIDLKSMMFCLSITEEE